MRTPHTASKVIVAIAAPLIGALGFLGLGFLSAFILRTLDFRFEIGISFDYFIGGIMLPLGMIVGAMIQSRFLGFLAIAGIVIVHGGITAEFFLHQATKPMDYQRQVIELLLIALLSMLALLMALSGLLLIKQRN